MIPKIEKDFIAADLATVENILSQLTPSDVLGRLSLESRRDELRDTLASVEATDHPLASAALFFSGQPVLNSQGIDSEFGANAIQSFQEIVSTVSAARFHSKLGQRGPVSGKEQSKLYVTRIVHGSFGFQFDELGDPPLFDSSLKGSVDQATKIMASFDAPDNEFGQAVEDIDERVLDRIRKFFDLVHGKDATFRIVSGELDKKYDQPSLERAIERARITTIDEKDETFTGQLQGLLPGHRQFEYRTDAGVIYGKIDPSLSSDDASDLNIAWLGKDSVANVHVKRVSQKDRTYNPAYYLLNISPRNEQQAGVPLAQ